VTSLPILIIGFVRPEGIERLLTSLQVGQVSRVYLAVDGPRDSQDRRSQKILVEFAQTFARNQNIPISIWQRDTNLGIAVSIISAIDWFFTSEHFGLILEDDLIVGKDFIPFVIKAKAILETQDDVVMISGNQFFPKYGSKRIMATHYPQIWGWATTSKKWQILRSGLMEQDRIRFRDFLSPKRSYWAIGARRALSGRVDTWDIPIARYMISNAKLCLIPPCNLVSNVGFDQNASHTALNVFPLDVPTRELDCKDLALEIPTFSNICDYDSKLEKYVFLISPKRILSLPIGLIRLSRMSKSNSLLLRLASSEATVP
jgi:hypothetical protein